VELSSIASCSMDWNKHDDIEIRRRLRQLSNDIDRMRRLKSGGLRAYSGEFGDKMGALLERLRAYGLFLVPVGELEEWLSGYEVGVSKSDKRAWSNAAAQTIQKAGKQDEDVWQFVSAVGYYLSPRPAVVHNP
jgi:hypothetical protein